MKQTASILSLLLLICAFNDSRCFPIDFESSPSNSVTKEGSEAAVTLDLSYVFDEDTIYWPTAKRFSHDIVSRNYTDAGFYYENNDIASSEHGGTHVDAPTHFCDPDGAGEKCWE